MQHLIIKQTDKYPMNEILTDLFIDDNYESFCNEYLVQFKKKKIVNFENKNFSLRTPEENLKYINFMLSVQRHDYSLNYIEYLITHHFTYEIIIFFESLKGIDKKSIRQEFENSCNEIKLNTATDKSIENLALSNIIKLIAKNKNFVLFKYFYENIFLNDFKSKEFVWKEVLQIDFKKAIEYLSPGIENVEFFMLDHIINKLLILYEKKSELDFYCNYLKVKNQDLLAKIIEECEISTSNYNRTLIEIDSPYQICCLGMPSVPPRVTIITLSSKEDIDHQKDDISKLIWQRYQVETGLTIKENTSLTKVNKI